MMISDKRVQGVKWQKLRKKNSENPYEESEQTEAATRGREKKRQPRKDIRTKYSVLYPVCTYKGS
jgi:hypothetical protein